MLVLASLRGLSPRRLMELAAREGSASACLDAVRAGRAGSEADQTVARTLDPGALEGALASSGARMVCWGSREYPPALEALADAPMALFVRGRPLHELGPRVSVVGARNCSSLGRDVARELGGGLARAGVCVVSGAARGIDAAAHEGALAARGGTIAVLACGIDSAYPRAHRELLREIEQVGAVVSEYAPGVPAEPFRFPARNRIVAGLSEALVVVEGGAGSGSLITADHALDLGRAVFAVPGAVTNPLAEVPLSLIREGAGMVRGSRDLLEDLGLEPGGASPANRLAPQEEAVLSHLSGPTLPDQLAGSLGWSVSELIPVLLGLEMRGVVRSVGGRFERRVLEPA